MAIFSGTFWSDLAENFLWSLFPHFPSPCQFSSKSVQFLGRYRRTSHYNRGIYSMYGFSSTKELNVLFKVREQYAFYDQISALFKLCYFQFPRFVNFAASVLTLIPKQPVSLQLLLYTPNLTTVISCIIIFQSIKYIYSNICRTLLLVLLSRSINSLISFPISNLSTGVKLMNVLNEYKTSLSHIL